MKIQKRYRKDTEMAHQSDHIDHHTPGYRGSIVQIRPHNRSDSHVSSALSCAHSHTSASPYSCASRITFNASSTCSQTKTVSERRSETECAWRTGYTSCHVLSRLVTSPPLELVFGPTHAPCTPRRASTAPARRIPSCCSHHCAEAPCISKDAPDGDASLARQAWCVADRGRPLPHRFPSPESVPASETPNRPFCLPGLCGWRERRGRGEEHEHEWSRIQECTHARENPWRSYPHHAVLVVP